MRNAEGTRARNRATRFSHLTLAGHGTGVNGESRLPRLPPETAFRITASTATDHARAGWPRLATRETAFAGIRPIPQRRAVPWRSVRAGGAPDWRPGRP